MKRALILLLCFSFLTANGMKKKRRLSKRKLIVEKLSLAKAKEQIETPFNLTPRSFERVKSDVLEEKSVTSCGVVFNTDVSRDKALQVVGIAQKEYKKYLKATSLVWKKQHDSKVYGMYFCFKKQYIDDIKVYHKFTDFFKTLSIIIYQVFTSLPEGYNRLGL